MRSIQFTQESWREVIDWVNQREGYTVCGTAAPLGENPTALIVLPRGGGYPDLIKVYDGEWIDMDANGNLATHKEPPE